MLKYIITKLQKDRRARAVFLCVETFQGGGYIMARAYNLFNFDSYKLRDYETVLKKTEDYFNAIATMRGCIDENGEPIYNIEGEEMKTNFFIKPPTIAGYALYLGVTKPTLDTYRFNKGEDIPSLEMLERQRQEVMRAIKDKVEVLSFTNRKPTQAYVEEIDDAINLRKIINVITYAYSIIEEYNSERLYDNGNKGALVVLKNSFGYTDKKEVEVSEAKKLEDFMKE